MKEGLLEGTLSHLRQAGLDLAEVYAKRGRSRRFELTSTGRRTTTALEVGWAVRAGDRSGSFFRAGTGTLEPKALWPEPLAPPLQLPAAKPVTGWEPNDELDAPLASENEAFALLETIESEARRKLAPLKRVQACLVDGASESQLRSSRGVDCSVRHRSASMTLEYFAATEAMPSVRLEVAEADFRRFEPGALARRVEELLHVRGSAALDTDEEAEVVLSPDVAVRLLAGLVGLWRGRNGATIAQRYSDRQGRLAAAAVTIVDDGRHPRGLFRSPVDGEGSPTRRVCLVDKGRYVQPLVSWIEAEADERATGCMRRPTWREPPRPGPSHLYLAAEPEVPVGSLVGGMSKGYYLLDAAAVASVDFEEDRFAMKVGGFVLRDGRALRAFSDAVLHGRVSTALRNVRGVARDLSFVVFPMGQIGAPTVRIGKVRLTGAGSSDLPTAGPSSL